MSRVSPWLVLAAVALSAGACGPQIELVEPFGAVNWSPHDGAAGVDPKWQPMVCLSRPVDATTLGAAVIFEADDQGEPTTVSSGKAPELVAEDPACILFGSVPTLSVRQGYVIVLGEELKAEDGTQLGRRLTAGFTTGG